jgi:hypothetical protein
MNHCAGEVKGNRARSRYPVFGISVELEWEVKIPQRGRERLASPRW